MFISEILSYGIFFELWTTRHGDPSDPTPFMNHLDYSTFLTFTSLLLFNRFFNTHNVKIRIFYFVYFLFVTSNLFLNGGRTGQLAFAVALFVVGFTNIKNKFLAFFFMLFLLITIFYTAYQVSPNFKERSNEAKAELINIKSNDDGQYRGSFGQRLGAWIVGVEIIKDNPIIGVGVSTEMVALQQYIKEDPQLKNKDLETVYYIFHYHNEYMQTTVQLGLIGLFLYFFIWYALLKLSIADKNINNLRIIFIVVFLTASNVETIFHNQFPMSLFALFVGIFIHYSKEGLSYDKI